MRDPRNHRDVADALESIQGHADVRMLESTMRELGRVGVPKPESVTVVKRISKGTFAIGKFFLLEEGLMFPDNVIRPCADCHAPLQFRPTLGYQAIPKLCLFCTADRVKLEQAKRGPKGRAKPSL